MPRLNTVGRISTSSTAVVTVTFDHVIDWVKVYFDGAAQVDINFTDGDFTTEASGPLASVLQALRAYEFSPYYFTVHTKKMYLRPAVSDATNIYYMANYKVLEVN